MSININDMERFSCEPPAQNKAINDLADGEADHRGRGDKAHLCVTGTPPPLNLARDCDVSSLVPERGRERGGGREAEKLTRKWHKQEAGAVTINRERRRRFD